MCGICGIVGRPPATERIARAMEAMLARGPDHQGHWSDDEAQFGHCRLSIIDLSAQGRQPMRSGPPGTPVIVFNGEIYNFDELRPQLELHFEFRSHSDTEVLLLGYRHWGIRRLLQKVRGMFAFAIWDPSVRELYIARDHCGKKPLYYTELGGGLSFASTLPALIELLQTTPAVDNAAVATFLKQLAIPAPDSILAGVRKLPPAHFLSWKAESGARVERYWHINYARQEDLPVWEWHERIEHTLREAVRRRLVADVPVGAFLSGGVDSSLIVALMSQAGTRPVQTVSIGFAEDSFNELPYAQMVAQHWRTIHRQFIVTPDAAAVLPQVLFACGEPFGDHSILPTYYVAKEARRDLKVVLTGDGGDESFAGYETARIMAMPALFRALLSATPQSARQLLRRFDTGGGTMLRKLRWLVEVNASRPAIFDPLGARGFRGFPAGFFAPPLQSAWSAEASDDAMLRLWESASGHSDVQRLLEVDFMHQLPSLFLSKVDSATMAHGLEARCPFLDLEVVELAARMPDKVRMPGRQPKGFLKALAARHVPNSAVYRRKQGFSMPLSAWFRGELGVTAERTLTSAAGLRRGWWTKAGVRRLFAEHRNRTADHAHRLWLLLMLELWSLQFVDRVMQPTQRFE